ncbi:tetratricopeptide repeat protein [Robertkochia solimangrovi]|uniref:tetratricopeptide repeat protein n=1 Tax=Robertkochia solimangrovi TaxID=2213046 RepID=UPI00117DC5C7|nr:tetratricopeptide repeat protein [Robertkochia solimangrovi]TRZ44342.1 hypothetical protein DMZ48_07475 [Robertkochia solimangrovi]
MRITILFLLILNVGMHPISAQEETTRDKAKRAITMMDNGQIEESIEILRECVVEEPENYIYPYEIAYARILQEDYEKAIEILSKLKSYEDINSQIYQLLGNCYSYNGDEKTALKTYAEGLSIFPNAGNLFLETGNIYYHNEDYDTAIQKYREGIEHDPMYPSNYYRLALLYLNSKDLMSGLIYGELFMNLERTTQRTQEMSKLLYETYVEAIKIKKDTLSFEFCDIIITDSELKNGELKLPLCGIYAKNMGLSIIGVEEINLNTLSEIRIKFIEQFYKEDYKNYSNALFEYHKKLLEHDLFDTYNHYLFQIGAEDDFTNWYEAHQSDYETFTDWYIREENIIRINDTNMFIKA